MTTVTMLHTTIMDTSIGQLSPRGYEYLSGTVGYSRGKSPRFCEFRITYHIRECHILTLINYEHLDHPRLASIDAGVASVCETNYL